MENIFALKGEKKWTKLISTWLQDITVPRIAAWIVCFILSRANFFGVIKPFATAFYVSAGFTGISKLFAIVSITAGNLMFSNFYESSRQALALLLYEAFSRLIYINLNRKETPVNRAALMGTITCFTGILRGTMQGFGLYDLVVSILLSCLVFSLAVILEPASGLFQNSRRKVAYSGRVLFSKAALICALVISLKGIVIWECEVGTILAGISVLLVARRMGCAYGACTGAFIGLVIALYDIPSSMEIPGMMALAGAAAGLPVRTRTMSSILWLLVSILFSGLSVLEGKLVLIYYEAILSGIIFLIMPNSLVNLLCDEIAGLKARDQGRNLELGQIHEAADRLFVLSKALSRAAMNIEETALDESDESSAAQWISEMVSEKVCSYCSLCYKCWRVNFVKTYKMVEKAISDIKTDETGRLEIPAWFKQACAKYDKFFDTLGTVYSIYKTESIWREKINESRLMLAKHASLVSGSIMSAARSLLDTSGRNIELEEALLDAAASSGIPVTNFRYNGRQESKPYIEAVFEGKNKFAFNELDEIVKEVLQSKFVRVGESRRDMMGYSVVRYMKPPRYKTATGVARANKSGSSVSGDNLTFLISGDGCHISAISDGKGSGSRAERYSRTAIQMLENLIEDGIELGHAIRILNLYLDIRGKNERLATMDICSLDLSNGSVSFYKYDAAPSFIKGPHGVSIINNDNGSTQDQSSHYKPAVIGSGDFVIMISDGIMEAFSDEGEVSALQWFIESIDTVNAQYLADTILEEAITRSNGNHDDLTVLVTRLW